MTRSDVQTGTLPQLLYRKTAHWYVGRLVGDAMFVPVLLVAIAGSIMYLSMEPRTATNPDGTAPWLAGLLSYGVMLVSAVAYSWGRLKYAFRYPVLVQLDTQAIHLVIKGGDAPGTLRQLPLHLLEVTIKGKKSSSSGGMTELEETAVILSGPGASYRIQADGYGWTERDLRKLHRALVQAGVKIAE